jgi:hypothetical protein
MTMTTDRIIHELRSHPHFRHAQLAANRLIELQAEVAELRATSRLQGALIGVAARVVAQAA